MRRAGFGMGAMARSGVVAGARAGVLGTALLALAGCGSSTTFANKPRPATPVNLTVYVNDARVSVSPDTVGAGELVFLVTNQARTAQSVVIHPAGDASRLLASTGPINPQSTDQVTVDFSHPGEYTVATAAGGRTEAAQATATPIRPASIHIGRARPSSSNTLLEP